MFGGFFNRLYYGNPNRPDLKEEDVKVGRFKLFFIVLQVRFWKLIQLNLLYSLFCIPVFFVVTQLLIPSFELNLEIKQMFVIGYDFLPILILVPCLLLVGPAKAASTYVIRNWARDEHSWLWTDFKDTIKSNYKQSILVMLINGIVLVLFYFSLNFYKTMVQIQGGSFAFMLLYYFVIVLSVIFGMMNTFIFPMLVTYKLSIKQLFKNAFLLTMAELPRTFLFFAISTALFLFIFYFSIVFIIPFFLIGLTFPMLINISYINWLFEKYFNKEE